MPFATYWLVVNVTPMVDPPLQRLFSDFGQSPWLDNLRRDYITSGHLNSLIDAGVRGLTSNPTIFQKAIQDSPAYDSQLTAVREQGLSSSEAYWSLVCTDITMALDLFRPLYESSEGNDGFVSVEVDPHLAQDAQGTYTAARDLWERIDRPNLMIKIPATKASLPAIRSMIASGANVNVTLIFGLERYHQVMQAYVNGLADRLDEGLSIDSIASVASFFISRVDTEIDRRLDLIGSPTARSLRGKAAISQARLAYSMFRDIFSGDQWKRLAEHGARVQRPLWASTSTKNPAYPDTLYVDQLIGPDSVNTLPDATLDAFSDHGHLERTIDLDLDDSRRAWQSLSDVGIDLDGVSDLLETEGLASFQKSFDDLMTALAAKLR